MRTKNRPSDLKTCQFSDLPAASILHKLEARNPQLVIDVLTLAEQFQRQRFQDAMAAKENLPIQRLVTSFSGVAKRIKDALHITPVRDGNIKGNNDNFCFDPVMMKQDIRDAIDKVMVDNWVEPFKFMTAEERHSLKTPSPTPYQ